MIKSELVEEVAEKADTTKKETKEIVDTFLDSIQDALARGEKVVISGFGTFRTTMVKEREVVVPGTNERVTVEPHRAARFSPGKGLKRAVK